MSKKTWGDVRKGDTVELRGQSWRVVKIKLAKKKAHVMVERGTTYREADVKLADRVTIVARKGDRPPLHDATGTAQRWATKREAHDLGVGLPKGDKRQTTPPAKPEGGAWDRPSDRIEKRLDDLLSARLIGEATDESAGYYVPPVDVTTVASHLAVFHGGVGMGDDEAMMLKAHEAQHDAAKTSGAALTVNHWHTERRP